MKRGFFRSFAGAVQFLTIVPVRTNTAPPGKCASWFPVVGVLVGLAALAFWYVHPLLAVLAWIVLTGGLHEDGLADCADAFRAGRSRERILEILKDSRIGTFGAIAIGFSILLRWQAIEEYREPPWLPVAGAFALSRGAMTVLAFTTPPAGSGLGALFARDLSIAQVSVACVVCVGVAMMNDVRGVTAVLATIIMVAAGRWYFLRRIGGVTGDCLGAVCQIVETVCLFLLKR